jgi:hypothetical protein
MEQNATIVTVPLILLDHEACRNLCLWRTAGRILGASLSGFASHRGVQPQERDFCPQFHNLPLTGSLFFAPVLTRQEPTEDEIL